ncbi:MAG: SRPBCC family protein [Bacteroidales bacterium]
MAQNIVKLHRVFAAPVEKVFKAFTDADAMASWLPPYGFVCKVHCMDLKIGGKYKMTFTNFNTGNGHSFGGEYLEIIPNELLKYTNQFDDPNLPGQMLTTIELKGVICGTELFATQEGIPDEIPTEMCYIGWQESLDKLKRLVEPNIPDA